MPRAVDAGRPAQHFIGGGVPLRFVLWINWRGRDIRHRRVAPEGDMRLGREPPLDDEGHAYPRVDLLQKHVGLQVKLGNECRLVVRGVTLDDTMANQGVGHQQT